MILNEANNVAERVRVRVNTTGSLLGIQVPGVMVGKEPFYVWLLNNKVLKGWEVALMDALIHVETTRHELMYEGDYDKKLDKASKYLRSILPV